MTSYNVTEIQNDKIENNKKTSNEKDNFGNESLVKQTDESSSFIKLNMQNKNDSIIQ